VMRGLCAAISEGGEQDNFYVQPGDIVVVP
jgi:hypothetical protein